MIGHKQGLDKAYSRYSEEELGEFYKQIESRVSVFSTPEELTKKVEELKERLDERNHMIEELKKEKDQREDRIEGLSKQVTSLAENLENLSKKVEEDKD